MRTIRRSVEVDCPFTAAIDLAARCCRRLVARHIEARPLHDHTDGARRHTALTVEFVPRARLPCPPFQALLTVRPWHRGTRIHVEARYEAPLGRVGRLADSIAGRHLAAAIIERFVQNLRSEMAAAWVAEREAWLPPPSRVAEDDPAPVSA